ncbi:MAG: hypothetical protein ACOWWO_07215 [Peptococcaceae bacterium]
MVNFHIRRTALFVFFNSRFALPCHSLPVLIKSSACAFLPYTISEIKQKPEY